MAHNNGGQTYGNQEKIRRLGKRDFLRYVNKRVTPARFELYVEEYPDTFISLIRQNNKGGWRLNGLGSLGELRPSEESLAHGWVKKVAHFSSSEAVVQAKTSDG